MAFGIRGGWRHRALTLFAFFPVASLPASASPEEPLPSYELPVVHIRADPLPDALGPFPLSTRRIGRAELERRAGGDLRDVLLPVAGVRVTSFGAPWAGSGVSLRGSTSEQVLVLVDGRRRNPAQGGGVDLASIPLLGLESVEVFRGGASALWGSDALGGALHVRTLRPEPGSWRLRVRSGSFGQRAVEGAGAVGLGRSWRARGSAHVFAADGDYAFVDDRRGTTGAIRNGDVRRAVVEARADGTIGPSLLRVDASFSDAERGVPGSEEFPTPTARVDDDRLTVGVRAEGRPGRWRPAVDLSVLRMERRYREPGASFGPVDETHRNDRAEGEAELVGLLGSTSVRVAGGASADRLRSTTDGRRYRGAINARLQLSHDLRVEERALRGMAAARLDAVDGFAPFLAPRVGALLEAVPDRLTMRVSAGLSHRTPSFDELFWPPRATAAGNPDLRPERGRDVDAGVTLRDLPLSGRLTVETFLREVDDLIQWAPGAAGIWRPHNVGRVRITGWEAEGSAEASLVGDLSARLAGSLTRLDARDRTGEPNVDGKRLLYRPEWTATAALLLAHRTLGELETSWRLVDDVYVTRANTRTLPGHLLGEIRWRRRLAPPLTVETAVSNVTDEAARDFRDYPLPGRSWTLALAWERTSP